MRTIALQGLRGGVGTTSVVAMLADALHQSGQSVLMVDMSTHDMLRLHFNVPFDDPSGWTQAYQDQEPWNDHVFQITEGMHLVPFGRAGRSGPPNTSALAWLADLRKLASPPDWLLIDLPACVAHEEACASALGQALHDLIDLQIVVASVDVSCHILLAQQKLEQGVRLLANMQDPSRELANDLITEWSFEHHHRLLPVVIKRDESVHEALALKTPVTRAYPESSAALDAQSLATWLQLHVRARA